MHPELSRRLVEAQLEEALSIEGLFSEHVQLEQACYPLYFIRFLNVGGVPRVIRFDCTNYDFQPIAIEPVDPTTRAPLPLTDWMRRGGGDFPSHHMKDGGPFLCLAGTRDYYTHEGHKPEVTGERWDKWRNELKIRDLITVLKGKFATGEWS